MLTEAPLLTLPALFLTHLNHLHTYSGTSMETVEYMIKSGRQFFFIPETGRYRITAMAPGGNIYLFI